MSTQLRPTRRPQPTAGSSSAAASSSGQAAAPSAAAAPAPAPVPEFNPPPSHGAFDRISFGGAGAAYARYKLFQDANLQRAWRHCVGVRGRKVTAARFQRLMRDAGQLEKGFSAADSDLLFMQTLVRSGVPLEDASGMGFHEFCDALMELARRRPRRRGRLGQWRCSQPLAAHLERLVLSLPARLGGGEGPGLHRKGDGAQSPHSGVGGGAVGGLSQREVVRLRPGWATCTAVHYGETESVLDAAALTRAA